MNIAGCALTKMAQRAPRWVTALCVLPAALFLCPSAAASRVKDLTVVEGARDNQLVGYGLVVGLAGDGDSNSIGTLRSVANLLQRYGLNVSPNDLKSKNTAAVMV